MEKISVNFINGTATITSAFQKKMQSMDSEEAKYITSLLAQFPNMKLVAKTHKTPAKYTNKNGEVTTKNQFKNLTYENMEKFISALPDSEAYLREYTFIKDKATAFQNNGYTLVRKWFTQQFPSYKSNPIIYIYSTPKLIDAKEFVANTMEKVS